jgi:alkylhydroperoxidase family enzyme
MRQRPALLHDQLRQRNPPFREVIDAAPSDIAILDLAQAITRERGQLSAAEAAPFKSRGLTDADILEVLVNVALNIFTNYTNHIAATGIDFRVVVLKKAA